MIIYIAFFDLKFHINILNIHNILNINKAKNIIKKIRKIL